MVEKLKDCSPTICDRTDLMTNEFEFMNKDNIKEKCIECTKQEVCIRIVELLSVHRTDDAMELIKYTDTQIKK